LARDGPFDIARGAIRRDNRDFAGLGRLETDSGGVDLYSAAVRRNFQAMFN